MPDDRRLIGAGVRRGIRRLFRLAPRSPRELARELDDEIRLHLELRVAQLVARGMAPDAAQAEALRRFGPVDEMRDRMLRSATHRENRMRSGDRIEELAHDVRYTLRALRAQPGFAAIVVLTLALGIGANAVMVGIVDRLMFRAPAGVVAADRVTRLYFTRTEAPFGSWTQTATAFPVYERLRREGRSFADVAAFSGGPSSFGSGRDAREVNTLAVTESYFTLLGVRPALGRFFTRDETRLPVGEPVVVLGHGFWARQFGGDPAVIGRPIQLGSRRFTVIGVAPAGFTGVDLEPVDGWVPMSAVQGDAWKEWAQMPARNASWLEIVARLRPGVTAERASAEAALLFRRGLAEDAPPGGVKQETSPNDRLATAEAGSLRLARGPSESQERNGARVAAWVLAMSVVLLLIACANVANLLLSRALRRRREIAVRLALGVGRGRLVRQLLVESVLLALVGGVAAVLVAATGSRVVGRLLVPDADWTSVVDPRVLAIAIAATLATGLLVGLLPAAQATRPDVVESLKAGAREGTFRRSRTRAALLVGQAALSMFLLVGAGLFVKSLRNVLTMQLGFDADRVLVVHPDLVSAGYDTKPRLDAAYATLMERVARVPGVRAVATSSTVPFRTSAAGELHVPGHDSLPQLPDGGPYLAEVTTDYFRTMGTRIVRGRGFTAADVPGSPRVAVVSETMARLVWPGERAIGKCIKVGSDTMPCTEVVGIAQDIHRQDLAARAVMHYYLPFAQHQSDFEMRTMLVRTRGPAREMVHAVAREAQGLAPNLPYVPVEPLSSFIDPRIRPWRLGATMFALFGALALLIAAVGLYGVLAYEATQRRHEFGVRMALGARGAAVARLVLRRGVGLVGAGLVAGAGLALAAGRWLAPLLFETRPSDPLVLATVAAVLLSAAIIAAFVPAWRASRVDPATVLRAE